MRTNVSILTAAAQAAVDQSVIDYQNAVAAHVNGDWGVHNQFRFYDTPYAEPVSGNAIFNCFLMRVQLTGTNTDGSGDGVFTLPAIFYGTVGGPVIGGNFGTITAGGVVVDRFPVGTGFDTMAFVAPDLGSGAGLFYYIRHNAYGQFILGTIGTSGVVTDRAANIRSTYGTTGNGFDALTFAAPDLGFGANLFYYIRHDILNVQSLSIFGTVNAAGVVTDRFVLGANAEAFDTMTFAAPDTGYGADVFYYVRHDNLGNFMFGVITANGTVNDKFNLSLAGFDALAFAAPDMGFGANLVYYVRHDNQAHSILGTITVDGTKIATDRFTAGSGFTAFAFAAPDLGYGANLFYYVRG